MATIHFILQGKGGVGKSMIAAFLYQAAAELGKSVEAFDTDPVNATLAGYKSFSVTRIDVLDDSGAVEPRKFDELVDSLAYSQCDHVIVDNGASSFVELGNYIRSGDILTMLQEGGDDWSGHRILLHTVVTGGQSFHDTIKGLEQLSRTFPDQSIVLWVNPYFGKPAVDDGMPISEFLSAKYPAIVAVVELPNPDARTGGVDLEKLFRTRQTFAEGYATANIAAKGRLKRYWDSVRDRIVIGNIL